MTTTNRLGETVRGFHVIVFKPNGKPRFRYPCRYQEPITGEDSVKLMAELQRRGHDTLAYTNGYCEETLTLSEMKGIFINDNY